MTLDNTDIQMAGNMDLSSQHLLKRDRKMSDLMKKIKLSNTVDSESLVSAYREDESRKGFSISKLKTKELKVRR